MTNPGTESSNPHSPQFEFARIYNQHWGPYAVQAMTILEELLLHELGEQARILDLCCGTGQLAKLLNDKGYQVTGIDSSKEMIHFAVMNAPNSSFVIQDARHFHLPQIYDAVISTYDSLNFIIEPQELAITFENVYNCLKEGGWFLFDLNTEAGYLDHWDNGTFNIIEDDHVCIVQTSYDLTELSRFDIIIFRFLDQWQRFELTLCQQYYSESDIRLFLNNAGLMPISTFGYSDETGLESLTDQSERMYFLCQKPAILREGEVKWDQ